MLSYIDYMPTIFEVAHYLKFQIKNYNFQQECMSMMWFCSFY